MKHKIDDKVLEKYPPIDKKTMFQRLPLYTICEVLREIYWLAESEDIKERARIAVTMAKKMSGKLVEYKFIADKEPHFDVSSMFVKNTSELWDGISHDRRRWYTSEVGNSPLMYDILPEEVTVVFDPKSFYVNQDEFNKPIKSNTIFEEVSILDYKQSCSNIELNFGKLDIPHEDMIFSYYVEEAFRRFKKAILDKWNPNKLHVVYHSSGYDSRLVSTAIKELYKEYGSSLGNTVFLNNYWESDNFKEIMKVEGWDESQCIIFNKEEKDPTMIYAGSFNFDKVWKYLNCGMISYPINANYEPIRWCQEQGILPDDDKIQCIGGSGSNEISRNVREEKKIGYYFERQYYHPLSTFPLKGGDWIFPFLDLGFIWFVLKYSPDTIKTDGIAKPILDKLYPELQKIPRIAPKQLMNAGFMRINEKLVDKAVKNYKNSWFYKTTKIDAKPTNKTGYHEWWGLWNLASTCEYLVNREDIRIRMWRD